MDHIETVIVGGGQAGLATSYFLRQYGREHLILEQAAQAGNVWRNQRWDSFTLVTPNWVLQMPGAEYNGADPHGFMPRDEIVAYFEQYVEQFQLPVQFNTSVLSVDPSDGKGYRVRTSDRTFHANNVVMATGFFQAPRIPPAASGLPPGILQPHSSAYRNPESLPAGAVLVVGSAQSGSQIAEELYQHGRKVFLSTGTAGRLPRRYRGKDIIEWLNLGGFFDLTPDRLPPGVTKFTGIPHFSGIHGGHTLNLHQFARDGVTLLGHLRGVANDKVFFAPDLHKNLAIGDRIELEALAMIDSGIQANGLDAPAEALSKLLNGYNQPVIEELDLKAAGINSVIWAIGYTFDYSLVKLPVRDGDGFPIQNRGATSYPGLFFVGMPWMPTEKSGSLLGVGKAAEYIASKILEAVYKEAKP